MENRIIFSSRITPMDVVQNGKVIGRIDTTHTKTKKYVLTFRDIYWRYGNTLSSKGGATAKWFKSLKLAKEYVTENSSEIADILTGKDAT